jgi:hypothetical protein
MIPGTFAIISGAQVGPILTYRANATKTTSGSTSTFTGQPFGSEVPGRLIVVAFNAFLGDPFTVSSITIGGVAATIVRQALSTAGSANTRCGLAQAVVPTGTTGTVSIAFNRSVARSAIAIWSIEGLQSTTAIASENGVLGSSGGSITLDLNCQPYDAIIAASASFNADTATWSGLTEVYDTACSTSQFSGASDVVTTAGSPRAISVAIGGTSAAAAAVWR